VIKKMKKMLATLAALALVFAIYIPMVSAQNIPTTAVVTGSGTPPVIDTIFVLNDTGDLSHVTTGTQILPAPGVGATDVNTYFMKYVVVSDPMGIAAISKVEEWLTKADAVDTPLVTTTEVTSYADAVAILDSALLQKIITQAEHDSAVFKLNPVKNMARMFGIQNSVNNHDKPGVITVHMKAIDKFGGTTFGTKGFDLLPIKAFETDFSAIDYGSIRVGVEQYIAGDDVWAMPGPDGTNRNTIKNQGNVQIALVAQATALSNGATPAQYIPAQNLSVELLGQHIYNLATPVTLNGPLMPCTPTQISFDVTAPDGTSAGNYNGNLYLTIV